MGGYGRSGPQSFIRTPTPATVPPRYHPRLETRIAMQQAVEQVVTGSIIVMVLVSPAVYLIL